MATYDLTSTTPEKIKTGDILNCPYSGSYKTITLPAGTYKLEVWGAMGGYRSSATYAGKGGYSVGTLTLTDKSTTLYLYAGGKGGNTTSNAGKVVAGGFNGGGYRYGYKGGGGGSDIRIGSTSPKARVIVAGGGGSDGAASKKGMYGGGTTGGSSTENYTAGSNYCGKGGTQTYSGYSASYTITTQAKTGLTSNTTANYCGGFGFGGGGVYLSSGYGGAGGGGWYGGSGSVPDGSGDDDRGGGGGSGYIYTSSTASNYPSGCLLSSKYYLSDASMIAGNASMTLPAGTTATGNNSDGYVRITVIEAKTSAVYRKESGSWVEITDSLIGRMFDFSGALSLKTVELITFTIEENSGTIYTFQATEGMTWQDWIGSEYGQTDQEIRSRDGVVCYWEFILQFGNNDVLSTDKIIADGSYTATIEW